MTRLVHATIITAHFLALLQLSRAVTRHFLAHLYYFHR